MTTMASWPVVSSTSCFIVTPSMMSWNSTLPAFSERIGTLYGSHCTKVSPFFTLPPSATEMTEPMTMLCVSSSRPSSPCNGDRAILVQDDVVAVFELHEAQFVVTNHAVELRLDLRLLEDLAAVPPMWNVRIVSCVPGSPMDCAAMMPTASPSLTELPGRQVAAVAMRRRCRACFRR